MSALDRKSNAVVTRNTISNRIFSKQDSITVFTVELLPPVRPATAFFRMANQTQ